MYSTRPNIVLGFHGCDESVRDKVVSGRDDLKRSENDYDWLGNGIYFWENNPERALDYAKYLKTHSSRAKTKIEKPTVIGAVIDLGYCLDLMDSKYLKLVKTGYELLVETHERFGYTLPSNLPIGQDNELLLRKLDCAVIETIHQFNKTKEIRAFDSVRGVFFEGKELFPNAGFREKNHIQICVRNPNCIKGFFLLRDSDLTYLIP
jgi:hypothetical protein